MISNLTLFIDVDSVVFDINKKIIDIANKEFSTNYNYKDNKSWWWSDYTTSTGNANKIYFEKILDRKDFFRSGELIDSSKEIITKLYNEGYNIYFLSAPHWSSKTFTYDRVKFLEEIFDWFKPEEHLILTSKKSLLDREDMILIDDSPLNLNGIKKGKSIAFGDYGWNKAFKGLKAYNWEEVYDLIHEIEYKFKANLNIDVDSFRNYMRGSHNE